jgi:hypothetical protein
MNAAKYDVFRQRVLNHCVGVAPLTPPTSVKLRLFTTAPTSAGGGVPLSGNGYADVTIPWNGSIIPAATSLGVSTQSTLVSFGFAAGGAWTGITAVDFRDASTNDLLWFSTFSSSVTVLDGQGFVFAIGDLVFQET